MKLILGGPGCGKTTRLLGIVQEELARGVPSDEIAFVAFTKAAAEDAKRRAAETFGLDPKEIVERCRDYIEGFDIRVK